MLILQDGGLRNESEKEKMGRGFFFFFIISPGDFWKLQFLSCFDFFFINYLI
jgi:hypothetical protein